MTNREQMWACINFVTIIGLLVFFGGWFLPNGRAAFCVVIVGWGCAVIGSAVGLYKIGEAKRKARNHE